ncbi:hypothetical protein [Nocardiopsis coralliicola]
MPPLVPLSCGFEDGAVHLGIGPTRDATMVEGRAEPIALDALPRERADLFAARTGFDPPAQGQGYRRHRSTPARIHARREADEPAGRTLMRDRQWPA